ncbi:11154_t:CDS:2 [Dentiscutata erythropus]|uniref:11154_t:CDS:1 n=1 Tax=Dentiscutata erythropus TaxID=1348616 RepID=A0A9N9I7L2_9GLOM|nr:11154_t:CDS:2 [Dentiscutata erythropus]
MAVDLEDKEPVWLQIIKMIFCWYIWERFFDCIKGCCCCFKSDDDKDKDNSFLKSIMTTGAFMIPGIIYALVHIFKWLELTDKYDKLKEENIGNKA